MIGMNGADLLIQFFNIACHCDHVSDHVLCAGVKRN